jgi:hypothetical protein
LDEAALKEFPNVDAWLKRIYQQKEFKAVLGEVVQAEKPMSFA